MDMIKFHFCKTTIDIIVPVTRFFLSVIYCGKRKRVPPVNNPLLLKSATALAAEIREGKTKSEDVIQAYIDRILEVEPYINATVDRCFEEALKEAKKVDNLVASGEYKAEQLARDKPLLGIPFTVKVLLKVKGLRCTGACQLLKDEIATEDSPCVTLLRNAGAIVTANTNAAEFGLSIETNNYVHGRTNNPYNTVRTSGGSSGGETALISAAGSVFGIGNDLGGSVRIPAHFTGIFGHKPSADIVPNGGINPNADFLGNYLVTGPMCRYAEDLMTSMRVLTSNCEIPITIGQKVDFKKVKILFLTDVLNILLAYSVDKEIQEGIIRAVEHFENVHGCNSEEMRMPLLHHMNECFIHILQQKLKENEDLKSKLTHGKGSRVNVKLDLLKLLFRKSNFTLGTLTVLNFIKRRGGHKERKSSLYRSILKNLKDDLNYKLDENTVLIMPTFPTSAPYHYGTLPLLASLCYSSVFNLTGFPVTQCHLGFDKEGMPYGMQIVGKKNNDNLTIACAIEIEKAFGGWRAP